jgi:hypothetical protein
LKFFRQLSELFATALDALVGLRGKEILETEETEDDSALLTGYWILG